MSTTSNIIKARSGGAKVDPTVPTPKRPVIEPSGQLRYGAMTATPDNYGSLPLDGSQLNTQPTGSGLWLLGAAALLAGMFLFGGNKPNRR